jgi:hypothetical protein
MSASYEGQHKSPNVGGGEKVRVLRLNLFARFVIGIVAIGVGVLGMFGAASASATQPAPNHKVTICHRTDSQTNPYVQITVDVASVDGNVGNDHGKGDHFAEHQGTVWFPGHAKEPKWGDIIPPCYSNGLPDSLPSLNWPSGQSIFENGCKPVSPPPISSTTTTTPPPTTTTVPPTSTTTTTPPVPQGKDKVVPHQPTCVSAVPTTTVVIHEQASIGYAMSKSATPNWVKREVKAGTYTVNLPALQLGHSAKWYIVVSKLDDSTVPVFYGPFTFVRPTCATPSVATPVPTTSPTPGVVSADDGQAPASGNYTLFMLIGMLGVGVFASSFGSLAVSARRRNR